MEEQPGNVSVSLCTTHTRDFGLFFAWWIACSAISMSSSSRVRWHDQVGVVDQSRYYISLSNYQLVIMCTRHELLVKQDLFANEFVQLLLVARVF